MHSNRGKTEYMNIDIVQQGPVVSKMRKFKVGTGKELVVF